MKTNSFLRQAGKTVLITAFLFYSLSFSQALKDTEILWKGRTIKVVKDEFGVLLKQKIDIPALKRQIDLLGFSLADSIDDLGITKFKIPETYGIIRAIEEARKTNYFEAVEPITITRSFITPNDPYYSNQWALPKINATAAWNISTGNSAVIVGILDSGIPMQNGLLSHSDVQNTNRILLGNDYISDGEGVKDNRGHGTHVAGIVSAETDNSVGISGISWNTKLFIVQVFNSSGSGSTYGFYRGVQNAVDNGARIINFSGGATNQDYWLEQGVIYARNNGALIVAAAGNYDPEDNPDRIVEWPAAYSASYDNVIAVSATDYNDYLADFSSRGSAVNVAAPGASIYSTMPNYHVTLNDAGYSQNYSNMDGTSMAAPYVAGLAGLIKSLNTNLTPSEIRTIIQLSADDKGNPGFDNLYGYGRINANKALTLTFALASQSVNQSATAHNGGRKLLKDVNNYFHHIFASGGEIFYKRKLESSGNWENPIILSKTVGENNYPSIAKYNNYVYVTWQKKTGTSTYEIYFAASSDNGVTWNNNYNYLVTTAQYTSIDPLPVIECDGYTLFLYFAKFDGIRCYQPTLSPIYPNFTTTWISLANFGGAGASTPTATINSGLHSLVYRDGWNSIQFKYYNGGWYPYGEINLSSIVPGGGSHLTPSLTSVPGTSQMHVAWKKLIGSGSSIYDHLIIHRKSTNYDTWPNEWFGTYYNSQENPSISALATNKVDLLYHTPSQFGTQTVYKMRFNGIYWNAPTLVASNARYPSVSSGNATARYVWTSGSSSPYTVNYSSVPLTKELELDPLDYYSRSIAWLDSVGSYLEIRLHHIYLKLKDGTKKRIDIVPADLETYNLTLSNSWDLLSSDPIELPSDAEELVFDYSISGSGVKNLFNESLSDVNPIFGLSNEKGEVVASKTQNYIADSDKIHEVRKQLSLNLLGLSNQKNTKAVIKLDGLKPREGVFASLGHIEDYTSLADKYQKQSDAVQEVVKVDGYNLGSYPNPFNPTATISYSLPERGLVKVSVFDILGREVTELVNEVRERGNYTITFEGHNLSSGVYICTIAVNDYKASTKLILAK